MQFLKILFQLNHVNHEVGYNVCKTQYKWGEKSSLVMPKLNFCFSFFSWSTTVLGFLITFLKKDKISMQFFHNGL